MDPDEEQRLLDGLRSTRRATRRDAEHALFEAFRVPIDGVMRRLLGHDTDDCVQEAFLDVFRGLPRFEGKARLSTWIYRVALRRGWKCLAARRRDARGRDDDEAALDDTATPRAAPDVPAQLAADELARRFAAALQRLDIDQRTVMALSTVEGLGPGEIAEILGVATGTVHSRMSRARARLRELLGLQA